MNVSTPSDLPSKITLGTAQFGLPYGVANRLGQPPYETARDILRCAIEGGVTCLDTAVGYGDSESVLGRALEELGAKDSVTVVTKIAPLADGLSSQRADELVEESVRTSLSRLRLERVSFCLFHRERDFQYSESLLKLRARGLVERVGCSMLTPTATRTIIESGCADAVQIPVNVLDRRFSGPDVAGVARVRGTMVFARSVYLQGLVLMPEATIPENLREVIPARRELDRLACDAGISVPELALRYAIGLRDLTSILVGVESLDQMRKNLDIFAKGPLPADLMQAVVASVPSLPDAILDPRFWAQRMPDAILKN